MESESQPFQKTPKAKRLSTGKLKTLVTKELIEFDFEVERLRRAIKAGINFDNFSDVERARMLILLEEIKSEIPNSGGAGGSHA